MIALLFKLAYSSSSIKFRQFNKLVCINDASLIRDRHTNQETATDLFKQQQRSHNRHLSIFIDDFRGYYESSTCNYKLYLIRRNQNAPKFSKNEYTNRYIYKKKITNNNSLYWIAYSIVYKFSYHFFEKCAISSVGRAVDS